ncbi:carboxymuconolactone decarboxylase [Pantoea cypripedii]|uniref:Carboxymuconolactone decarboxylase n=1 Tax=Pantoea cypripedii TaxID=55209 RepID=A0A6B9GHE8_PANCY|nr:carboxymuconolactone decarboxylase [Pantoea cypripedii]QGY33105.1 carboxymuconolactone decarboxylase [Pantoea cypripedii]
MNSRLQKIEPDNASASQQEVIAKLSEARGRIPTPFNIWLHNPNLAKGMEIIGTHIDSSPVLDEVESEVAILSTAVFWNAPYVIANHRRHAIEAGVPETVVEAILSRQCLATGDDRLGLICQAVWDLLGGGEISDQRFARYAAELGRAVIAELLIVIGYFTSVSLAMTLHALQPKASG